MSCTIYQKGEKVYTACGEELGIVRDYDTFKYCPACGKELNQKEEEWVCGHIHVYGKEIELQYNGGDVYFEVCIDCVDNEFEQSEIEEMAEKLGYESCPRCERFNIEDEWHEIETQRLITNPDRAQPRITDVICESCYQDYCGY